MKHLWACAFLVAAVCGLFAIFLRSVRDIVAELRDRGFSALLIYRGAFAGRGLGLLQTLAAHGMTEIINDKSGEWSAISLASLP